MPTYEYACVECGQHVDVVQSMSDPPLTVCAACGGRLRRVYAPIGIVFKGSGFYRTDSRGKSSVSAKDGAPAAKDGSATKTEPSPTSPSSASSSESGDSAPKRDSKSDSSSGTKPTSKPAEKSA